MVLKAQCENSRGIGISETNQLNEGPLGEPLYEQMMRVVYGKETKRPKLWVVVSAT
jgi:hypothetical protein